MTGFDSYSPLKWLVDGALAVHVKPSLAEQKKDGDKRTGSWAPKAVIAAAALGVSVAAQAFLPGLPTGTAVPSLSQLSSAEHKLAAETPEQRRIAELRAQMQRLRAQLQRGLYEGDSATLELAQSAASVASTALPANWAKRLADSLAPA